MRVSRSTWGMALLFALGIYFVCLPLQDNLIRHRPEQYKTHVGFGLGTTVGPTPVLIAALGGFRTVAADLLWMKVEDLSEGGSSELLPQVYESVVDLDPHFILAWTVYGWHLAYNLNAESLLAADKHSYLDAGVKVLQRGIEANPNNFQMHFEYAWTLQDRKHDLYPAAEAYLEASKLKGADARAIRLRYRCYEKMLDFKHLFPAMREAQKEFPKDKHHQWFLKRDFEWWHTHWNDPAEHHRQIVNENTARRQRALDYYLYPDDPYWSVCPVCGLPTPKGHPVCEICGGYSFAEHRLLAPPANAGM